MARPRKIRIGTFVSVGTKPIRPGHLEDVQMEERSIVVPLDMDEITDATITVVGEMLKHGVPPDLGDEQVRELSRLI